MVRIRNDSFAYEHLGGWEAYARASSQVFKRGRVGVLFARKDLRRSTMGAALDGPAVRLLHDLEPGVCQGVARPLKQRNPNGFAITLEQPREDV